MAAWPRVTFSFGQYQTAVQPVVSSSDANQAMSAVKTEPTVSQNGVSALGSNPRHTMFLVPTHTNSQGSGFGPWFSTPSG